MNKDSKKIFFGAIFIAFSLFLIYASFTREEYDIYGKRIESSEDNETVYSNVDCIGVEYFIKNNSMLYTSPQVISVIVFSTILGILIIFKNSIVISNICLKSWRIKYHLYLLCMFLLFFSIKHFYLKFLFMNYSYQIIFSMAIFMAIFLSLKLWQLNSIFDMFVLLILCFYQGLGLLTELGNFFAPLFIHEGEWALIDGNGIAIYNTIYQHNFTFGYILFRLLNIILILVSSYIIFNIKCDFLKNNWKQ